MKQKLLLFFLTITFLTGKSQVYYMCSSSASVSTSSSGTLYDSGGPSGNYYSYEDCAFLIKTNCPGNITINFTSFSTELNYDYLTVYNGSTTASPILGSYWGTGALPPMTATSGFMLVTFYSDGSGNFSGFTANWSFSNPTCPPQANFNMNTNSCQGKVIFTDATTFGPTSWLWNFGDGNASTLQNPVHTYTMAGSYNVNLISGNTNGTNSSTKLVTVNPINFAIGYNGFPLLNSAISFTTDNTSAQVYTWNFGDGGLAGSANAIHTYTAMGTYTVALTIASGTCVATSTMQVVIKDGVGVSDHQSLSYQASVYPNPFNSTTQLSVQLTSDTHLRIMLVNQLGQLVSIVNDKTLATGEYTFDIVELPSGIYYVTINNGALVQTLKLISIEK